MAKEKEDTEGRLSLVVGVENKELILQASAKDGRSMNQWATRVLRAAAIADLEEGKDG